MTLEEIKARCDEVGDCWIWKQGCTGRGMPQMRYQGQTMHPRRAVMHMARGEFPKLAVGKCGNTMCCSPACAVDSTPSARGKYAEKAGYRSRAADAKKSAITRRAKSAWSDAVIAEVRSSPLNAKEIAQQTGMSWSYVKSIRAGTARRDYSNPFAGLAV